MVIWTPQANADLKSIHAYISNDAPLNANKVISTIINKTDSLLSLPHDSFGKKVSELDRDDVREIHIHAWRIIYLTKPSAKYVLTVFHFRRELIPKDIQIGTIDN